MGVDTEEESVELASEGGSEVGSGSETLGIGKEVGGTFGSETEVIGDPVGGSSL